MKKLFWILVLALICTVSQTHAFGLNFGLKVGDELYNHNMKGGPNPVGYDSSLPTTFLAMGELDLSLVSLELNVGSHSSLIAATRPKAGIIYFVNQEFAIAAIARFSIPIVPKVLSLDLGGGLDQRVLVGQHLAMSEKENADASGSRTMLPISAQVTVNVPFVKFYIESRFNVELTSDLSFAGFAGVPEKEMDANHEFWLLGGIAF